MEPLYYIGQTILGSDGGEGEINAYDEEEGSYEIYWDDKDPTWESEEAIRSWQDEDYDDEPDVDEAQEWADFDPDC